MGQNAQVCSSAKQVETRPPLSELLSNSGGGVCVSVFRVFNHLFQMSASATSLLGPLNLPVWPVGLSVSDTSVLKKKPEITPNWNCWSPTGTVILTQNSLHIPKIREVEGAMLVLISIAFAALSPPGRTSHRHTAGNICSSVTFTGGLFSRRGVKKPQGQGSTDGVTSSDFRVSDLTVGQFGFCFYGGFFSLSFIDLV